VHCPRLTPLCDSVGTAFVAQAFAVDGHAIKLNNELGKSEPVSANTDAVEITRCNMISQAVHTETTTVAI